VTRTQQPTEFNKRVGANVKHYRLARGMSQADLAAQLTVRDFPFHQQAILKVERGTRPLKVEEASAIADIFGLATVALLRSEDDEARQTRSRLLEQVNRLEIEIDELDRQLVSKTRMLQGTRETLAKIDG
jgi:transcriptional regulator with XRE-family HTH domain